MLILNQSQVKRTVTASTRSPYLLPTLLLSLSMVLVACSKPAEKTEDIRPVRVIIAALEGAELQTEFSGEIRAKVESRLGFRVPGKIIARKVDVGTVVKRGQVLMQLDPQDLLLGQAQAKSGFNGGRKQSRFGKSGIQALSRIA